MFSGNTILGDGAVIMIIDPNGIAKALGAAGSASHELSDDNAAGHVTSGEQLTSLLVFRAGTSQPKAVPLGLVTRLEEIATDKIELSNGRYMVQYREQLMPLVQMADVTVQTPAPSRSWCSPTTAAPWASWSTRSSTSSRSGSTSRSPAARTAFWARP